MKNVIISTAVLEKILDEIDKTSQKIVALAKSAEALGEPACLTEIAGVLVTIHAKKFETPVGHDRFASLNLNPNDEFPKHLWSAN